MTGDFYRAFEDRYRGSRELIKSRLRVYLPFVGPLRAIYADGMAVDLGCGRGEWLELLREEGIRARGVDLDEGMLAACHELGLQAEKGEAIANLRSLPESSVAIVSAFHVVEHIPFAALQALVQEAWRVLKPAGLLILETPNPENLSVGTSKFYYDPTHQKPIPPALLSFLPEHYGFARTKVLRLQEAPGLAQATEVTLSEVLSGVSPDYAVVAQKAADAPDRFALFEAAFAKEYGVDLDNLAMRYDNKLADILTRIDRTAELELRASAAEQQAAAREAELAKVQQHLVAREVELGATQQYLSAREAELAEARHHCTSVEAEFANLLASTSWRVTTPLRVVANAVGVSRQSRARKAFRDPVGAVRYVMHAPRLAKIGQKCLRPFRSVAERLRGTTAGWPVAEGLAPTGPIHGDVQRVAPTDLGARSDFSPAFDEPDRMAIDEILRRIREELGQGQ